ncbi:MBL fold metallo-hydrolase [Halalkalibacter alkalisediminis]|uniref:MBL fold metallo-hydrolase n=1 Tax=Halalkalibacter alkalisediminis TaxID=935616 RepID=A0ABV6NB65_9BACI|nr:MBL fold metallo-hydrolase [Halalkalibacter alkalisediminis]
MTVQSETIHQLTIPTPFLVGPVHVYLICSDTLTLVDTGPLTLEGKASLISQLDILGYKLEDIEQVILTHHHPDHVGLAGLFKSAVLIGHRYLRPWLRKEDQFFKRYKSFFEEFYHAHGFSQSNIEKVSKSSQAYMSFIEKTDLDVIVSHGDEVPGLKGWRVLEVPGHAQNHIMIVRTKDHTAIGADVLLGSISSNALLEAPMDGGQERPKTLIQYRKSLQLVQDLNLQLLMPGHGEIIMNVNDLIDQRLEGHLTRANVIKNLLGNKRLSANEISYQLFKEKHLKQPDLTFSETLGHLDLLVEQSDLIVTEIEGIYLYHKIE